MGSLSNSVKNGQNLQFRAGGQAIAANDAVQIGGFGLKAFPVKTIDYAVKQAITTIAAQASLVAAAMVGYERQAACTDQYGNIYTALASSGGTVNKYGPNGGAALTTAGNVTASSSANFKIFPLSNGDIAVLSSVIATGVIWFAIIDASLGNVKAATNLGTTFNATNVSYFDACALTGGGFAVSYLNGAGTQMLLQTYDNTGTAVLAATNIQTFGGTPTLVFPRIGQLSNGNLAVAMASPTATPAGLTFVVVTTAAVSVKANTVVESTTSGIFCELSTNVPNVFAVAGAQGANSVSIAVYNNAGTIQGSKITHTASCSSGTQATLKLTSDTTQFWLFGLNASNNLMVSQIPITGTNAVQTNVASPGAAGSIDAVVQGSQALVFFGHPTTTANSYYHIALPDAEMGLSFPYLVAFASVGSVAATTGTRWPRVLFNGDFTGIFVYDQQSTAGTFFSIIKFAASSIEGVSQTTNLAASPGTFGSPNLISVNPGPGMYPCNAIAGTNGVGFAHSSASIPGNNGKLFSHSIAMSGIGVPRPIN